MASACQHPEPTGQQQHGQGQEGEFERMVEQLGGRGSVYLVGDAEGESSGSVFQEFILDMFQTSVDITCHRTAAVPNGHSKQHCPPSSPQGCPDSHAAQGKGDGANVDPQTAPPTEASSKSTGNSRSIHCAIIIFIFRHAFLQNKSKRVCMVEILRDVKSRAKKARARQALIGLVHAEGESSETCESVALLEETLRSVFKKRPHDSIWTGYYTPKASDCMENIRRNACKAVNAAQSTENLPRRKLHIFWPPQRWFNRGLEEQPDATTHSQTQKGHTDEGIPLQMRS